MSVQRDGVFTGTLQVVAVVGGVVWAIATVPIAAPFLFMAHLAVSTFGSGLAGH